MPAQWRGIRRLSVLYNENVQISTESGVPIEIANSGKVQGKRYLSNTVGCSNKWSICNTPSGIYFMDSYGKDIYLFNGQLNNLSTVGGFNSWAKQTIPDSNVVWNPKDFGNFTTVYDPLNQEVLFINRNTALAWSEKLQAFTSFYDYGDTPYFNSLVSTGIWVRKDCSLWKHQGSDVYCNFFDVQKPYSMTLIGNPEPQLDKTFTNLEFRACVDGEGKVVLTTQQTGQQQAGQWEPTLPFDSLETWNEYQHGIASLKNMRGYEAALHHQQSSTSASLKRKFRIWRCDIPRDNAPLSSDSALGIYRTKQHFVDRMRNPWLYLKLEKTGDTSSRTEVHDLVMTYFG